MPKQAVPVIGSPSSAPLRFNVLAPDSCNNGTRPEPQNSPRCRQRTLITPHTSDAIQAADVRKHLMKVTRCSRPEFVITHWDITMCYLWFYIGLQVKLVSDKQLKEINDISNSAASPDVSLLHGEPFIQNGHSRFSISLYAEASTWSIHPRHQHFSSRLPCRGGWRRTGPALQCDGERKPKRGRAPPHCIRWI